MSLKYWVLTSLATALVALDQATKIYVHSQFRLHETVQVIQNYFNITYVRNPGAAFGFLAQSHPEFREPFFLVLPPIAMLIILWVLRSVQQNDRVQIVALSMVFGGAIGNYIDRLRFGYVIDFLDFHIQNKYTWPAFNVADSAIVVGIGILLIISFVRNDEPVPKAAVKRKSK